MPLFRRPLVELRRVDPDDSEWVIAAVVLDGAWYAADPVIEPAGPRLREVGLVCELPLLPFIAADVRGAVLLAVAQARELGYLTVSDTVRRNVLLGSRSYRVSAAT